MRDAFNDIWTAHIEYQNWSSSAWWFFVFLPKQEHGYGPKQMMFTYASRQGKLIKVNQTWQPGFSLDRKINEDVDSFWTTVVGWINDGDEVHEEVVHQPVIAKLYHKEQKLFAFQKDEDGNEYGAEIKASEDHDYGIDGNFVGKNGHAKFTIWTDVIRDEDGNIVNHFELPEINQVMGPASGKLGNTHFVAWRKFNFKGSFKSLSGEEELEGVGYFQRVLMNIPMPPWKWMYAVFEDGSIFSSFMLYAGIHAFRRKQKYYRTGLERRVFHLLPSAYIYDANTHDIITFDKATIEVTPKIEGHPDFEIHVWNDSGDEMYMHAETHNHAQFLLDRRIIAKFWQTKFIYNEYLYEITKIKGSVNGKPFTKETHGRLWGNIEYVFGWSL